MTVFVTRRPHLGVPRLQAGAGPPRKGSRRGHGAVPLPRDRPPGYGRGCAQVTGQRPLTTPNIQQSRFFPPASAL